MKDKSSEKQLGRILEKIARDALEPNIRMMAKEALAVSEKTDMERLREHLVNMKARYEITGYFFAPPDVAQNTIDVILEDIADEFGVGKADK